MTSTFRPAWALALLLFASGCVVEQTANCTTTNCSGCCDRFDQCQVGSIQTACGSAGNACDVCVNPQICQLKRP